jgi:hypothetical protein
VPQEQQIENLETFLAERGQALMRTAVLLAGGVEAGEDLLQTALERLLRHADQLDGDPGDTCAAPCATWRPTVSGGRAGGGARSRYWRRTRSRADPPIWRRLVRLVFHLHAAPNRMFCRGDESPRAALARAKITGRQAVR